MTTSEILTALDDQIARLRSARSLLTGTTTKRRGRPPASKMVPTSAPKKRTMSAAGRNRIAEAQRKRWAKQKAARKA